MDPFTAASIASEECVDFPNCKKDSCEGLIDGQCRVAKKYLEDIKSCGVNIES